MSRPAPVIAVDGPSGSGKGTIANRVAQMLGWHRLDSGALYRCVGLAALRQAIPLTDEDALTRMTSRLDLKFEVEGRTERIWLDGADVTDAIRTEECGQAASAVAALPRVRQALLERQRAFAVAPGLVADGRDMGTVVFPDAELKVFLTASVEERAQRRYKQLKEKGISVSLRDLSRGIADRDHRDASRTVAPLRPADDAKVLDSTALTPDAVVQQVLDWVTAADISDA